MPSYHTVTRTQGNNRALKTGLIKPASFEFAFEEFPVLVDAFRIMVRENRFDICEMALTTYLCAKAHGQEFTAIPVFLVRAFHHGAILINKNAGIKSPKDLEGRRVGVNRGYTVTTGVWARAVLQREHNVDLSKVTWVLSGDEHVAEYVAPPNVVPMKKDSTMAEQLASGDLAAAIGLETDHPDIVPLIPDANAVALEAFRTRGYYPINHIIVIKDQVWQNNPGLASEVFDAFVRSKQAYLKTLKNGEIASPDAADRLHLKIGNFLRDPLPYGIEANRVMLQELIDNALIQGIIEHRPALEELFIPETQNLSG